MSSGPSRTDGTRRIGEAEARRPTEQDSATAISSSAAGPSAPAMAEPLEALIAKTQAQLQPLVPKPKLADKLLSKPPFRFLHDVFAAVAASTGFAKGLYNDFEADSANLKEKHHKVAYLDKMIVCVGQAIGRDVDVRAAKIVAGLEPENTNLLLQALAQAAGDASLDWAKAVQTALAKVPSLAAEGAPVTAAAATPAAEAKGGAEAPAAERPPSKEKSGDADRAAAAEAKAKEKAKREEAERKAEAQRREAEAKTAAEAVAAPAESKLGGGSGSTSCTSSSSSSRDTKKAAADTNATSGGTNNQVDEALLQNIKECNGDVERTKEMIEKIIAKPKMSAKLLSKPPFRFLHDIVSEITRVTGFGDGLYSGEELDSAAIKEKGPKMDYLTKIMQCVSCQLNVEVDAKAAKIVAGLEPDDTNKFLQLLALACRTGSSAEAVRRVLAGDTALRAGGAAKSATSSSSSASSSVPAKASTEQREATPEAKLSSRSSTPQDSKSRRGAAEEKQQQPSPPSTSASAALGSFSGPMKPLAVTSNDNDNGEENMNLNFGAKDADNTEGRAAPGTSGDLGTSRTSRPTTARRRPPKLKENVTEVGRLLVHDTKVAPVVGIMKDGDNNDSDDEAVGDAEDNNSNSRSSALPLESGAHGRLVRDILKDQNAEEEQARKQREEEEQANEAETGIRLGRRKKSLKDRSKGSTSNLAEMNELRSNIQKICQAANPVGKGIEFVHEDLDAMSKELEYWKKEYAKKRDAYDEEKKKTDEALQPLQMQLLEVDEQIKEQIHKINSLKATIAKNEEKTQKLLRMVVSA